MIHQTEVMEVVQKYRGNAVVVPEERAGVAWPDISTFPHRDMSPEVMGKGTSFGLGICLSQPNTKVIVFDGDGGLEMNLGTLVTIAEQKPRNLYHFVLENGIYATTGGQPIPGQGKVSFTALAKAAGYPAAYDFEDLEEFSNRIEGILNETGPVMICVKTVPNPRAREERYLEEVVNRRTDAPVFSDLIKELAEG